MEKRPVRPQGERVLPASGDTDVAALACLSGGVCKRRGTYLRIVGGISNAMLPS